MRTEEEIKADINAILEEEVMLNHKLKQTLLLEEKLAIICKMAIANAERQKLLWVLITPLQSKGS